tara:strand:- start:212 stop:604 length:393 start_codon:yes stop_codon:yes gene_type:complete
MIGWKELSKYNFNNPPTIHIGRDSDIESTYSLFIKNLKSKNIKVSDYLYNEYFKGTNKKYIIKPNNFPYKFSENISHLLLWINPKATLTNNEVIAIIKNNFQNKNIVYFENIAKNKSVKEIRHIHILVKN